MDRFNGFSQDEINRVITAATDKKIVSGVRQPKIETNQMGQRGLHQGIRRMPDKWPMENNNDNNNNNNNKNLELKQQPQQYAQRGKALNNNKITSSQRSNTAKIESKSSTPTLTINIQSSNNNESSTLSSEESLSRTMSKSIEDALFYQPLKILAMNGQNQQHDCQQSDNSIDAREGDVHNNIDIEMNDDSQEPDSTDATIHHGSSLPLDSPFKGLSLKEFEVHRKMIEEQNKQKKQLLCKAIELHSQKTAAETRKIEEIKIELAKLDNELSADVAILRKQIETACIHFSNIEKHYIKIEAQFLKAKMEYHQAAEKKELLTEHLCMVIAHNEDRKADKLSELMHKAGISPNGDIENVSS